MSAPTLDRPPVTSAGADEPSRCLTWCAPGTHALEANGNVRSANCEAVIEVPIGLTGRMAVVTLFAEPDYFDDPRTLLSLDRAGADGVIRRYEGVSPKGFDAQESAAFAAGLGMAAALLAGAKVRPWTDQVSADVTADDMKDAAILAAVEALPTNAPRGVIA